MKWTKELDDKLAKLIHQGKRQNEVATILNLTIKSINNRCYRLKLKTIYHQEYCCQQCGKFFIDFINIKRLFCSKSCSNKFSNLNRVLSDESKEKIKNSLLGRKHSSVRIEKISGKNNPNWVDGRSVESNNRLKDKVDNKRKCKYCKEYKIDKKNKAICEDCKVSYYKFYRPACEFKFDIVFYKNEFIFDLVEKHGWYSPSNKGNNLNGVSKDHLYSVRDGFINKVESEIISHPANCQLLQHKDNNLKKTNSLITLEELKEKIKDWDLKYGK